MLLDPGVRNGDVANPPRGVRVESIVFAYSLLGVIGGASIAVGRRGVRVCSFVSSVSALACACVSSESDTKGWTGGGSRCDL